MSLSRVSVLGNLGIGDGFPNTSLILMEHGYNISPDPPKSHESPGLLDGFSRHKAKSQVSPYGQKLMVGAKLAHHCTIFLCHLDLEIKMIDIDIQISTSERSSDWATN